MARTKASNPEQPSRPHMTDEGWNDWVIGQLREDEKDPEGNPNVDGLRRLVEFLLGDVVSSVPTNVEGASNNNTNRATVAHVVTIAWMNKRDDLRSFGAVADVYSGNTDDEYARFAAATADTRAEARALRKALRLKKVVAAEEITCRPVNESGLDGYIVKSQEKGIDTLCKRMNINVIEFINSGSTGQQYKHFSHIRYKTGQGMIEALNRYQQNMDSIPESLKGYNENWRTDYES